MIFRLLARKFLKISKILKKENLPTILIITLVLVILSASLFYLFEVAIAPDDAANKSMGVGDCFWWTIVTFTTVGYGDFFPVTLGGRIVAGFSMVFGIGLLGALIGVATSLLFEIKEQEIKGMKDLKLKNHIVICGFPKLRVENFIKEMMIDEEHKNTPIVIITDVVDEHPLRDYENVYFVYGSPTQKEILEKANLVECKSAIIFAESNDPNADDRTILTVLLVESINSDIYTCAELIDNSKRHLLEEADCDEIVPISNFSVKLLSNAYQSPGVTLVFDQLLSNVGQQIFKENVPSSYSGKKFKDMQTDFISKNKLIIAMDQNDEKILNPEPDISLSDKDAVYYISKER